MAEGCSRTQQLADQLPLDAMAGLSLPLSLTEATAVSGALQALYQDEPSGCFVRLKRAPLVTVPYPLENASVRETALHGILDILKTSEKPTTARHLFGADLSTLRWALRSEKDPNLLVGWLLVATFSDLNGIEDAVMDLAEQGATPQIRAGAIVALLFGMPDRILKAYDPRVRALATAAADASDALVREQGRWLLARADAVASGSTTTPGVPLPHPPTTAVAWEKPGLVALWAAVAIVGGIAIRRHWPRS